MADYETEEQQVEALKKWWADNGRAVLLGIGLGLAAIFSWRGWQGYKTTGNENASSAYSAMMESLQNEDQGDEFLSKVDGLKSDHSGSSYAAMASLAEARYYVEKQELPKAEGALRWVVDKGAFTEINSIARMRLARVLSAQDKHDDALAVLDKITSQAYTGMVDEIRGDIYYDKGEPAQALTAYRRARESGERTVSAQSLQMKMEDLAEPESSVSDDKS